MIKKKFTDAKRLRQLLFERRVKFGPALWMWFYCCECWEINVVIIGWNLRLGTEMNRQYAIVLSQQKNKNLTVTWSHSFENAKVTISFASQSTVLFHQNNVELTRMTVGNYTHSIWPSILVTFLLILHLKFYNHLGTVCNNHLLLLIHHHVVVIVNHWLVQFYSFWLLLLEVVCHCIVQTYCSIICANFVQNC